MKKSAILLSLLSIFLLVSGSIGCTSDDEGKFVGKWEWIRSVGGITGNQTSTPESPGHTQSFVFDKNGKFTAYQDGTVTGSGIYKLKVDKTIFSADPKPVIGLFYEGNQYPSTYVYSFEGNTLNLKDNAYDGSSHEYHKVSG